VATMISGQPQATVGGIVLQQVFGISPQAAELLYGVAGGVGGIAADAALARGSVAALSSTTKASNTVAANAGGDAAASGNTVKVFRVQGGTPPLASRNIISIDANGNPVIKDTTLNISIGTDEHAQYFLQQRPGAQVVSFDIPNWMHDFIKESAIPQFGYKSNPLNQGGLAPKIVDPTTPGMSYELPSIWGKWLQESAVPGSGKVR
ncbi:hypothetical protein V4C85_25360, partial [Ralstonia solanacearum]